MRDFAWVFVLGLALLLVAGLAAQTGGCDSQLPVAVVDSDGASVQHLDLAHIRVKASNEAILPKALFAAQQPPSVAILIDTSEGSAETRFPKAGNSHECRNFLLLTAAEPKESPAQTQRARQTGTPPAFSALNFSPTRPLTLLDVQTSDASLDRPIYKYAFTFFGGIPFTTHNYGQITCGGNSCGVITSQSAQFAIGAALERYLTDRVSFRLTFAGSHVDPPFGYFNISTCVCSDVPVPRSVPNGATLYSAEIDAIVTAPRPGHRIKPYLAAGFGYNTIHIPGGDTVMESNAELGAVIGGGLRVQLPQRWELRPELRFFAPFYTGATQPVVGANRITIGISRTF